MCGIADIYILRINHPCFPSQSFFSGSIRLKIWWYLLNENGQDEGGKAVKGGEKALSP
jgi:hypothetical protein